VILYLPSPGPPFSFLRKVGKFSAHIVFSDRITVIRYLFLLELGLSFAVLISKCVAVGPGVPPSAVGSVGGRPVGWGWDL